MSIRNRAKQLTTKFIASPVLPMLGWTKVVESYVAGGPLVNWTLYATIITGLWVLGDEIKRRADDMVHMADQVSDELTE